jgi:osmotically-inducible protein OsmY
MKTDLQLKKDVSDELEWDPSIAAAGIGVESQNGYITLTGHVRNLPEKLAAERAAERVGGVKGVIVKLNVGQQMETGDEALAKACREALQAYVHVPADDIRLHVEKGWVTLSGDVQWGYQRHTAEHVVGLIRGVNGVLNDIRITPGLAPEDIEDKIGAALRRHAEREASHIHVKAEAGVVTLEGTVDSLAERRAAAGAAWSAPGVSQVINNLRIR